MILFVLSCFVFLFTLAGMYYQEEMAEAQAAGSEGMENLAFVMVLGMAVWAVCVAFTVKTLSAYILCTVLLLGFIISFLVEVDTEHWPGKALHIALDVVMPALAFLYIVSYLYPRR